MRKSRAPWWQAKAGMPLCLAKINGIRVLGLLSSALRHAVTWADANKRSHASRRESPHPRGAPVDPRLPTNSAVSNSPAELTSQVFKLSQDSSKDVSSALSVVPKYGVNDSTRTLGGDAVYAFLRA